jgi:quercetin dioxygenase-like cupin family protein
MAAAEPPRDGDGSERAAVKRRDVAHTRVLPASAAPWLAGHPSEPGGGIQVCERLGARFGARHLSVFLLEFAAGAEIRGHRHPYEESFFILSGRVLFALDGRAYELGPGDFGFVPIAAGHAWHNPGPAPCRLLRVHSPLPRSFPSGSEWGVFVAETGIPSAGDPIDELDPRHRNLGHFGPDQLPPAGNVPTPGYRGPHIRDVAIRLLVDGLIGSQHHALFIVQFSPGSGADPSARQHWHPFEEMYYVLHGEATVFTEAEQLTATTGDLIFAQAGAAHGFAARGPEPVTWIEAQSPLPPSANGFLFPHEWDRLQPLA